MEHCGVIPVNTSVPSFLCMNVSKVVALGVEYSVYVFDPSTGEVTSRVNHYPHKVTAGTWDTEELSLATCDAGGNVIITKLKYMTFDVYNINIATIFLCYHLSAPLLFALSSQSLVMIDSKALQVTQKIEIAGFKVLMDYFCPQKAVVISSENVSVVRGFRNKTKVYTGRVSDIVDAAINPSIINCILILTSSRLLEYDTVSII
jgi:hypothetical protein